MRILALIFVVFGVALAGGAAYFASEHFKRLEANMAQPDPGPKTVKIIAALRGLKYGDKIDIKSADKSLRWINWPEESVPKGAFTRAEDLFGPGNTESRTILRGIEPGELILQSKVSGFGEDVRVAAQLSAGKRAFTIPINAVRGVAGLIAPGDRVDILLTRTIQRQPTTSLILQDVLVIATDQRSNKENTRARIAKTATVEVDPKQASKLTLAQSVGKLTLTLRGMNEAAETDVEPVRLEDLPAQPVKAEPAPAPAPAPKAATVRVRRAGQAQEVSVD